MPSSGCRTRIMRRTKLGVMETMSGELGGEQQRLELEKTNKRSRKEHNPETRERKIKKGHN